jgi:hypothetical protein
MIGFQAATQTDDGTARMYKTPRRVPGALLLLLLAGSSALAGNLHVAVTATFGPAFGPCSSTPSFGYLFGGSLYAGGINNSGLVAVSCGGPAAFYGYAFLRQPSGTDSLNALPSMLNGYWNRGGWVTGINDAGEVVGVAIPLDGVFGFVGNGSEDTALPQPYFPAAINDKGVVVGDDFIRSATGNFTIWNYPGAHTTSLDSINDHGVIFGRGLSHVRVLHQLSS